jgi:nicotinate-nucleotide adenylyltransferase
MRIGIFGGTFDPVHQGHLVLAEQAREQARLDRVWFLPAPRPPQKRDQAITRYEQRVEMIQLAIAGNPTFAIDETEKDRAGPSYTVDTLAELTQKHPEHEFLLLIGSDTLADLEHWYQPARLVQLAPLVVMARPGTDVVPTDDLRARLKLPPDALLRLEVIHTPLITIASRDLRQRVATGRTIRYFVPRAVEVYIAEKGLYKP